MKGVVFTIDAILALAIFIGATFLFYSYFTDLTTFGMSGANVYSTADNLVDSFDKASIFSYMVYSYYVNDTNSTNAFLSYIKKNLPYPINVKVFVWDGNNLSMIINNSSYSFEEFYVLRKYLVLTLDRGISSNGTNVDIYINSSTPDVTLPFIVSVTNPTSTRWNNVLVTPSIYDYNNTQLSWTITPSSFRIGEISPGATRYAYFVLSVPSDALIDEYYIKATVSGGYDEVAIKPFNIIRFGMVEMEVDAKR